MDLFRLHLLCSVAPQVIYHSLLEILIYAQKQGLARVITSQLGLFVNILNPHISHRHKHHPPSINSFFPQTS